MTIREYSVIALAKEQLEMALEIFFEKRSMSSSITLAGAAEEILGKSLRSKHLDAVIDSNFEQASFFNKNLRGIPLDESKYVSGENAVRNALKHRSADKGDSISLDMESAACWLLVRALENANRLSISIERSDEFSNWFYENMVGV